MNFYTTPTLDPGLCVFVFILVFNKLSLSLQIAEAIDRYEDNLAWGACSPRSLSALVKEPHRSSPASRRKEPAVSVPAEPRVVASAGPPSPGTALVLSRLLDKHGRLRVEARLLEGLLGILLGGDEARVGGHELEVDHPSLGGRRGLDPAAHLARVRVGVRLRVKVMVRTPRPSCAPG